MTLETASAGFKNQGQFIAALHVSQNLNIPFKDLKSAMVVGTTPALTTTGGTSTTASGTTTTPTASGPMSLGQAIRELRPSADVTAETTQARTQTSNDVRSATGSTSTFPATPSSTTTTSSSKTKNPR